MRIDAAATQPGIRGSVSSSHAFSETSQISTHFGARGGGRRLSLNRVAKNGQSNSQPFSTTALKTIEEALRRQGSGTQQHGTRTLVRTLPEKSAKHQPTERLTRYFREMVYSGRLRQGTTLQ